MTAVAVSGGYSDEDAVAAIAAVDTYLLKASAILTENLDFSGFQAVDMLLELLDSDPSGAEGRMYFNTNAKKIFIYSED